MASKLEVIGHDGSTFDWMNPQDGFELRRAVELLALAMRDKLPFTTPPDNFYGNIQSVYEMIWRFRENTQASFTWYIRRDINIGDDVPTSPVDSWKYDWDSLGVATGDDLTFFKDMVFNDISCIQTGTIFPKSLLTTMYKIVAEISLYRANYGELPMDSYAQEWVNYEETTGGAPYVNELVARFESNIEDPTGRTDQTLAFDNMLSYINDNSKYSNTNNIDSFTPADPVQKTLVPSRIGAYYHSFIQDFRGEDLYRFFIHGKQGTLNYPSLAKSFNFGYYGTRSDGFQDLYSAGEFNNTFPDATTEYYQYVYSRKNGTGYTATNFFDFGSGFVEDKISHIQQAFSADGYILRTAPLTMDFSTVPNEMDASYGCHVNTMLAFNINESRFTDYYTTP
tara:strand:- start:45 stop:1229 length:1185 start_codon:yes stop_codon:yes gene_type:complete